MATSERPVGDWGSIAAACSLGLMAGRASSGDHRDVTVIASAPGPTPLATRREGTTNADGQRAGPSGQRLFEAAADRLAAARVVAADSSTALGPTRAWMEASLAALAETAQRMGEDAFAEWISRPMVARNFDRLAAALRAATSACNDARRAAAESV